MYTGVTTNSSIHKGNFSSKYFIHFIDVKRYLTYTKSKSTLVLEVMSDLIHRHCTHRKERVTLASLACEVVMKKGSSAVVQKKTFSILWEQSQCIQEVAVTTNSMLTRQFLIEIILYISLMSSDAFDNTKWKSTLVYYSRLHQQRCPYRKERVTLASLACEVVMKKGSSAVVLKKTFSNRDRHNDRKLRSHQVRCSPRPFLIEIDFFISLMWSDAFDNKSEKK